MPLPESGYEEPQSKDYHIEQLRHLLEDFSDEIPDRWISGDEGSEYKVKMGWWQPLLDALDLANDYSTTDLDNIKAKLPADVEIILQ